MTTDMIELLDADLVHVHPDDLALIDRWKGILTVPTGWHYDLDFIWILRELRRYGLKPGARVLDAGGGNGLMQFLLASMGHDVVSVDHAARSIPRPASWVFEMGQRSGEFGETSRTFGYVPSLPRPGDLWPPGLGARKLLHGVRRRVGKYVNPGLIREIVSARRESYGRIEYAKGDFRNLEGFENGSVDFIVSVSALEHNDLEGVRAAVQEFRRVLSDDGVMLMTVSATKEKDWWFEACSGWCFTESTLVDLFDLGDAESNYHRYDELFARLVSSETLRTRVPAHYSLGGDNGLPWGTWEPRYLPVGILKQS